VFIKSKVLNLGKRPGIRLKKRFKFYALIYIQRKLKNRHNCTLWRF